MDNSAFIMMISTITIVTAVTLYFFIRVLKTPPKGEPDSYSEND